MGNKRRKEEVYSTTKEESYKEYIGEEPKVKDVHNPTQLLALIAYQRKHIEWLESLSKAKHRRCELLKKEIVRFSNMMDEHIPLKIDNENLDQIAYMKIRKKTPKEEGVLDVLNILMKAQTLLDLPLLKSANISSLHIDILILLNTYEYLKISELEKICKYRGSINVRKLRTSYLIPLQKLGYIKGISVGPKASHTTTTYIITETGRSKLIELANFIMEDKLQPIKLYDEYYRKRSLKNENNLWEDFGFPLRPLGKEEVSIDRRSRIRNRKQVQQEP